MIDNYEKENIRLKEQFERAYLKKYKEVFEIRKPVGEFIYEEYFSRFRDIHDNLVRDGGGGMCSCGEHFMGPLTIPIALNSKNYTIDRDLILENSFYTTKCYKCGKPVLYASPIYIDIDKKIVITRYIDSNFQILLDAGYKIYEVKYEPGGLEGYIKIIEELEGIKKPTNRINEKLITSTDKNDFKELFRIKIDNTKDLVVSETEDLYWVSEFLNTESYTGFTTKGFGFKKSNLKDFIDKCNNSIISKAENEMQWANSKSSKLLINLHESKGREPLIDIRQYINQPNYSGYTKKGIRVQIDKFQDLLAKLKTLL
jgi:hypothetical protein